MSDKNYYRVIGKVMLVARNPKKTFKEKYDLTNYSVQLSQGDSKKFYLYPIKEELQLDIVRFVTDSVEERARWYTALTKVMVSNTVEPMMPRLNSVIGSVAPTTESPRANQPRVAGETLTVGGKPLNLSTLTDISQFLSEQNNVIDGQMSAQKQAIDALSSSLDFLEQQLGVQDSFNQVSMRISNARQTTGELWRQHLKGTAHLRQVT